MLKKLLLSWLAFVCVVFAPASIAQQVCYHWCVDGTNDAYCAASASSAYAAFLNAQPPAVCSPGHNLTRTPVRISQSAEAEGWGYTTPGCDGSPGPYYPQDGMWRGVTRKVTTCESSCASNTGQNLVLNFTVGYTRSSAPGAPYVIDVTPPFGDTICHQGCRVDVGSGAGAVLEGWGSTVPTSTGLYRKSADVKATGAGTDCQQSDAQSESHEADPPACTGSTTIVNGKPYCAGTAQNPVANDRPDTSSTPRSDGNPSAGEKPSNGSGREPANGDGGPRGGPGAGSGSGGGTVILPGANGNGSSGTIATPASGTEQAACGAPGQPKCSIDESGTPTRADAQGAFTGPKAAVDTAETAAKTAIDGASNLAAPGWSWTFQFPTGCTPLTMPAFGSLVIDVCQWQPMIHDLMALCWIAATIWCCIGMVGRTLKGA